MPSESVAQRKFFGWIEHTPASDLPARARSVKTHMTHQQMHDFAATKDAGLPGHVQKRKRAKQPRAASR